MANRLDAKFYGEIRKVKDGSVVPEDEYMVFLAHDNAFPFALSSYLAECHRLGADTEHIMSVERTIERVKAWRKAHPDKLKVPDARGEKLQG